MLEKVIYLAVLNTPVCPAEPGSLIYLSVLKKFVNSAPLEFVTDAAVLERVILIFPAVLNNYVYQD